MSNFAHLHVHTEYSLLDGASRIAPLIARAKELGQTALAITDHGVMFGVIDFYKEAKKQGIKPVIGCEVYVAPRTRFDKEHRIDNSPHHLVLLCRNNEGYQNLIKLVSAGFIEGFYSKPRVDRDLLKKYSGGLIALSACLAGEIPRCLLAGDYARAKETAFFYRDTFGAENYFLEIQNHGIEEQLQVLPELVRLSKETGIPLVATNDSHYIRKEDSKMQNILVCIQTNRTVQEGSDMEFATDEFYIKSEEEMRGLFGSYEGAIENTQKIADRCCVEFEFGNTKLPFFKAPTGEDNATYFRTMCYNGLYRLYGQSPEPAVVDRLEYELNVITTMGYVDYYLIVHDFIAYARSKGISVGPGRGSGAGSLAAYCIGITGIDPIKYNLLFERFLNPERISMPDFDIDFCYERRQEVIDYVVEKYGSDHVAQIITFGTMAARGSVKDVGRAMGISYQAVDALSKSIPFELNMTLQRALEVSPEFRRLYDSSPENKELVDMARKLEGISRHASTHAAGVVITRDPVDTYVPLQKNDQSIVTQFTMTTLEELGLLKMDFLGLRNLTVIQDAQKMIQAYQPDFTIETIPMDDVGVFEMLAKGQTAGVFQFESAGMKQVLINLRPETFEDLIAVISLYRPGPMDSIPLYIRNRHNPEKVRYKHPLLAPILNVTYGCIVYQEQVMQICRQLAGYSYGRADLVRRAMSKKKADVMEKERHSFIHGAVREDGTLECPGAVRNGVDEQTANEIFDEMSSFASYAFNKSHAAAYAMVAYQTAYLKHHFPKEYMAALLTSVLDNTDKIIGYITECKKMGIPVLSPDINLSDMGFGVDGGSIRFGLLAIKNLGRGFIRELLHQRQNGEYRSLVDFLERMQGKDMNKRTVESLIKSGALDCFGYNRRQMLMGYLTILSDIEHTSKNKLSGQMYFFDDPALATEDSYTLPEAEENDLMTLLTMEKEVTGLYISGHPLSRYQEVAQKLRAKEIAKLATMGVAADGKQVVLLAVVVHKRTKTTRSNEMMAFIQLEDQTGSMEMLVFPRVYQRISNLLTEGSAIVVKGRIKSQEEEDTHIICEEILPPEQAELLASKAPAPKPQAAQSVNSASSAEEKPAAKGKRKGLYLKFPSEQSPLQKKATTVLEIFEGSTPVIHYYEDSKKYMLCPQTLWVSVNDVMVRELKNILGEGNVVYIS